jgi:hypothetical protein
MQKYVIKNFQKGFERDQARIGVEIARTWVWPYAYDLEDLLKICGQPDFDPDTHHYCFLNDKMVGYMFSTILPVGNDGVVTANMEFPRILVGNEDAAGLLMNRAFENLINKGVSRVVGRVSDMCPGEIQLAEENGYSLEDRGYKIYYSYEMAWGKLNLSDPAIMEIDLSKDLEDCAKLASLWYKRPADWCQSRIKDMHKAGIITQIAKRKNGKLTASCLAARNPIRPATAAIYYIYTPYASTLKPMLAKVVDRCIDHGVQNVIADLIYEHRQFESVYEELGFKKVAEWTRCEKDMT